MTKKCTLTVLLLAILLTAAIVLLFIYDHKLEKAYRQPGRECTFDDDYDHPHEDLYVRYDFDGVLKASDEKIYDAPVPAVCYYYYGDKYRDDKSFQTVICPVSEYDLIHFLTKYFPYQKISKRSRINMLLLESTEEKEDESVSRLGDTIKKPMPGKSVRINAKWNNVRLAYFVTYFNPDFQAPLPSPEEGQSPEESQTRDPALVHPGDSPDTVNAAQHSDG